jgi:hypothetical protein
MGGTEMTPKVYFVCGCFFFPCGILPRRHRSLRRSEKSHDNNCGLRGALRVYDGGTKRLSIDCQITGGAHDSASCTTICGSNHRVTSLENPKSNPLDHEKSKILVKVSPGQSSPASFRSWYD